MRALIAFLGLFAVGAFGDFLEFPQGDQADLSYPFPEFEAVMGQRGYAYITAILIMMLLAAVVYCHVSTVRKQRLLEQYTQQGRLPEWSPLLIDRKNIRPPPPYEQVV